MGNDNASRLRGSVLDDAANTPRNPDTEVRTDDEKDTLYNDGLEVEDDSETYADTHAEKMPR